MDLIDNFMIKYLKYFTTKAIKNITLKYGVIKDAIITEFTDSLT